MKEREISGLKKKKKRKNTKVGKKKKKNKEEEIEIKVNPAMKSIKKCKVRRGRFLWSQRDMQNFTVKRTENL